MANAHRTEIDRNYDFFQRNLNRFLVDHEGAYALLRNAEVVDYFGRVGDAYRAGIKKFPDRLFSIQLVTKEPVELGNWSVALV